ncbi:hypothetical protein [Maridesulfovibrio sp.]|uniref:hypothetical protein n=1 Tax=Maridesulfovibrio sp. TaxID=2795000 RepID=UPI0029F5A477|nr:hypothetical protein [Maridesulfovibrio sp.]
MVDKIPDEFMSISKKVLEEEPDLRKKLQRVMGKVADAIVKDKYVDDSYQQKRKAENKEDK